jgi:hypothetical protein
MSAWGNRSRRWAIGVGGGLLMSALTIAQLAPGANSAESIKGPYGLNPQELAKSFSALNAMECDQRLEVESLTELPRLDFRNLDVGIRIFNDRIVLVTPAQTMYRLGAVTVEYQSQPFRMLVGNQLAVFDGNPDPVNYFTIILDWNAQNALLAVLEQGTAPQ